MEGEFGTQDYKMQILVDLKSQNLEAWMAKHCYVNTMVARCMLITSHYISQVSQ